MGLDSKNLHRRHLNESQRAMVAAKIVTLKRGGDRRSENFKQPIGGLIQENAATILNVGTTSTQRAARVRDKGIKELQQAVESGDVSLWAADEIARQPQEEQRVIVSRGERAVVERHKSALGAEDRQEEGGLALLVALSVRMQVGKFAWGSAGPSNRGAGWKTSVAQYFRPQWG
jgi:hypothetical protein